MPFQRLHRKDIALATIQSVERSEQSSRIGRRTEQVGGFLETFPLFQWQHNNRFCSSPRNYYRLSGGHRFIPDLRQMIACRRIGYCAHVFRIKLVQIFCLDLFFKKPYFVHSVNFKRLGKRAFSNSVILSEKMGDVFIRETPHFSKSTSST